MKAILTAAWAAVLFVTSLPAAAAQPPADVRHVKVDYSDLDLTKSRGQTTLQHRVNGAISQACAGSSFTLRDKMDRSGCISAARTGASRDVADAIAKAKQSSSQSTIASPAQTKDWKQGTFRPR